jgi:anti-anti-sigma factor
MGESLGRDSQWETFMTAYRHFQWSQIKDVLVVQLVDELLFDPLFVNELQDELLALLEKHRPTKLLVNFKQVSQCSTSVINALLSAKKRLRLAGGDVKLCSMHPVIREAYQLLNLDGTVFHIHDTEGEAMAAFGYMSQ